MQIIKHKLSKARHYMAIVPYGDYLNAAVVDCDDTDIFVTIDNHIVRILKKSFIPINSDIANSISIAIYDASMGFVYDKMKSLWGRDINKKNVMLVVMEKLGESSDFEDNNNNEDDNGKKEGEEEFLWSL